MQFLIITQSPIGQSKIGHIIIRLNMEINSQDVTRDIITLTVTEQFNAIECFQAYQFLKITLPS